MLDKEAAGSCGSPRYMRNTAASERKQASSSIILHLFKLQFLNCWDSSGLYIQLHIWPCSGSLCCLFPIGMKRALPAAKRELSHLG